MRSAKLFLVLLTFVVTSDGLAAFLNLSSWHTVIDLPPDSSSIQIHAFAQGKVGDKDLIKVTKLTKESENTLTIMAGTQDGKYRFVIINSSGSYGAPTQEPVLDRTLFRHLSEKVREGDVIL